MTILEQIKEIIAQEPVRVGSAVLALVESIIGVLVAFNVAITPEQTTSILTLVGSFVAITLLFGAVTRKHVTPNANPRNNAGEKLVPEVHEILEGE